MLSIDWLYTSKRNITKLGRRGNQGSVLFVFLGESVWWYLISSLDTSELFSHEQHLHTSWDFRAQPVLQPEYKGGGEKMYSDKPDLCRISVLSTSWILTYKPFLGSFYFENVQYNGLVQVLRSSDKIGLNSIYFIHHKEFHMLFRESSIQLITLPALLMPLNFSPSLP